MSAAEPKVFPLSADTPWGRSVTEAEFAEMVETGHLQGPALERFWRMSEFQGPMPDRLEIQVLKRDVDRLIRLIKRDQKLARRAARAHGGAA